MTRSLVVSLVSIASLGTAVLCAQQTPTPPTVPARQGAPISGRIPKAPNDWGIANTTWVEVPAVQFHPIDSQTAFTTTGFGYSAPVGSYQTGGFEQNFGTGITSVLPAGALLTELELDLCDTNAAGQNVHGWLTVCDYNGQTCTPYNVITSTNGEGCTFHRFDISSLALTVDKFNNSYTLLCNTDAFDGTNVINGMIIGYQLQVSAAPPSPTFNDVPTSDPGFQYIEALVASGITAGCGGGNYCPDAFLTRRQMAVFLSKAFGLFWAN